MHQAAIGLSDVNFSRANLLRYWSGIISAAIWASFFWRILCKNPGFSQLLKGIKKRQLACCQMHLKHMHAAVQPRALLWRHAESLIDLHSLGTAVKCANLNLSSILIQTLLDEATFSHCCLLGCLLAASFILNLELQVMKIGLPGCCICCFLHLQRTIFIICTL